MDDGKVLVVGGHDDHDVLDSVEILNIASYEVFVSKVDQTFRACFFFQNLKWLGDRNANNKLPCPIMGWLLLGSR